MVTDWLTETELEVIRWYRTLNRWQIAAVQLWLTTGDDSQLIEAFSPRNLRTAA